MKNDYINIERFFVLEKIMARVDIHVEMKVKDSRGSHSPLTGG